MSQQPKSRMQQEIDALRAENERIKEAAAYRRAVNRRLANRGEPLDEVEAREFELQVKITNAVVDGEHQRRILREQKRSAKGKVATAWSGNWT